MRREAEARRAESSDSVSLGFLSPPVAVRSPRTAGMARGLVGAMGAVGAVVGGREVLAAGSVVSSEAEGSGFGVEVVSSVGVVSVAGVGPAEAISGRDSAVFCAADGAGEGAGDAHFDAARPPPLP